MLDDVDDLLATIAPLQKAIANELQEMIEANDHLNARNEEFNDAIANVEAEQALHI